MSYQETLLGGHFYVRLTSYGYFSKRNVRLIFDDA